jgi:general stress protein 26
MSEQTDITTAWALMERISLCMLVTHDGTSGRLRARPMSVHLKPDERAMYFLTDVRNHKDDEIERDQNVCVTFADSSGQRYVSVSGVATVSNDRERISQLWSPAAAVWFKGKEDPNIRVLHVAPAQAEFWDGPGALVTLVKMATATLTGTPPDLGANKKISF